MRNHGNIKNEIGNVYGRLTVVGRGENSKGRKARWNCICSCGNFTSVLGNCLRSGHTKSCGCINIEYTIKSKTTHGMTGTSTYNVWSGMRNRCNNTRDQGYKYYGGRGIIVCKRWNKFENFLADMGKKPKGMSIDRIDNGGSYCKDNCRWATNEEQANNTRGNRIIDVDGEEYTMAQLSRKLGIDYNMLREKLNQSTTS